MKEFLFNLIKDFSIYEPFITVIVKLLLTFLLLIFTVICFKIFWGCIKEHLRESSIYMKQRETAEKYFESTTKSREENSSSLPKEHWKQLDPNQVDYLNKLAEAYNREKQIVKEDVSNLMKIAIPLLSAISLLWIGKVF